MANSKRLWCTTTNSLCQSRPDGLFFGVRMDYSGIRLQKTAGAISTDISTGKMTSHITATALHDHSPMPHFTLWRNCTLFVFPSTKGPYGSVATILRVQASIYRRRYVLASTYTSTAHTHHTPCFATPFSLPTLFASQKWGLFKGREPPVLGTPPNLIVRKSPKGGFLCWGDPKSRTRRKRNPPSNS